MSEKSGVSRKFEPIAIVGVSAIFPGDGETSSFWRDIVAGRDFIREVPESYWLTEDYFDADPKAPDKIYAKRGSFLSGIDFDTLSFGLPPQILPETDTAQLLALVAAKRVLDEVSREGLPALDKNRVSVILGVTAAQKLAVDMNARIQRPLWAKAMREAGLAEKQVQKICDRISGNYVPWRENTFPGLLGNVVAGRIANRFNLGGTNCVTDAACASSFAALSMAIQELHLGDSDLAISGGVDTFNDPFMYMCFSKTPALSPTGDCRPFSEQADGTILGEGIGMFALKRLSDAERDGNTIYAVIRGLGTSSDGRAKSVYAPLPEGQAKALRRAYALSGYGPETVELVEAHGTGTIAGDQAELEGLKIAFGESGRTDRQWCALGTVKSQIGHTKAAAGAAGLYKAAMALHHKILPPTIKASRPHPKFGLPESPFYLNTQARPWIRDEAHPRRASVSSFGFGGSNFHLALEEHVAASALAKGETRVGTKIRALSSELVLFSGADSRSLLQSCTDALSAADLRTLARASQLAFDPGASVRLAVVAKNPDDLRDSLSLACDRIRREPAKDFTLPTGTSYSASRPVAGKTAFIFPGQGSQYLEMGAELAMSWDAARSEWDFSQGFKWGSERLSEVVFPRPALNDEERDRAKAQLTRTEWAQPAIGTASLALLALLEKLGLRADCMAGHSFGELTALHAAGVLDRSSFLSAARKRGELMAQAAGAAPKPGAMLAVVAGAAELEPLLREAHSDVVLANRNSPRETVLSGATESIEKIQAFLKERGLNCQRLHVATAFHSPLVEAAGARFEEFLGGLELSSPRVPVFSNAQASVYPTKAQAIRRGLADQIKSPVRFVEMIEALYASGARTFVEVGPSSVLTRLVGDILGNRPHLAVALDQRGREAATSLWRGLGNLAVAGVALDFSKLWIEYGQQSQSPSVQSKTSVKVSGESYGKPKPAVVTEIPTGPTGYETMHEQNENPVGESHFETSVAPAQAFEPSFGGGLLGAFAEIHRSTAEAHSAYQRAMADSHAAFLKASEETLSCLAAHLSGQPLSVRSVSPRGTIVARPASIALPAAPQVSMAPVVQRPAAPQVSSYAAAPRAPSYAAPAPRMAAPASTQAAPASRTMAQPAAPKAAAPQPAVAKAPTQTASAAPMDLKSTLFEVVAEKTGYPAEMLKPEMELEADLGIDSIKRVEILSALKKRVPGLMTASAQETAAMRSLEQILAFTEKKSLQSNAQPLLN